MEFESPDPAAASPPRSCLGGGGPPRTVLTSTGAVTARQERARWGAPERQEPVSWVAASEGVAGWRRGEYLAGRRWRLARSSGLGSATPAWAPRRLPSSDQAALTASRTSWPSSTSASTAMICTGGRIGVGGLDHGRGRRLPASAPVWPGGPPSGRRRRGRGETSISCQGLSYACHASVRAGWGAEAATMTL